MNPTLRNILALIVGLIVGSLINSGIITLGGSLIPLPEGVDPNDLESIKANMHRYSAIHFMVLFLAHALGTLAGSFICAKIAVSKKMLLSILVGIPFLAGGIYMVQLLPSPAWFNALDLVIAYLPMAWLGFILGKR